MNVGVTVNVFGFKSVKIVDKAIEGRDSVIRGPLGAGDDFNAVAGGDYQTAIQWLVRDQSGERIRQALFRNHEELTQLDGCGLMAPVSYTHLRAHETSEQ